MTNSEVFIDYYNKIDKNLRRKGNYDIQTSFSEVVKNSKNKVAKRFKDDLLSLSELRNAIVHNPKIDGKFIAEPHEKTVKLIQEIYEQISNPKKVSSISTVEITGAKEEDYINEILKEMSEKSLSQFPVYDENNYVIELINTNTIARWLSQRIEAEGEILVEKAKVGDLIKSIEFSHNYRFISKNATIYEAYDMFIQQISEKKRHLDVIFITHSGKQNQKLHGLITIEDIAMEIQKHIVYSPF